MRLKNLIIGDICFQIKYGFYFIYAVLTFFYIMLLFAFPDNWRENSAIIMIFSDPAAMGLFFMGAIVLLEKSERVIDAIVVSPVKATEYIFSKIISFCFISIVVALFLALAAGSANLPLILLGTGLTSVIFTLLGLIAATKISSLNQFVAIIMPIEIVCFIPPIFYFFDYSMNIFRWYPINLCIGLISGKPENIIIDILIILATIAVLFVIAYKCTLKMWKRSGGVKI